MWSDSDIIANEMCNMEPSSSVEERALPESQFIMNRSSTISNLKREGFTFTWKIKNFTCFSRKTGEFIQSPKFLVEKLEKTEWYLRLYPRGDVDKDYVACYLYRRKVDEGPEKIVIGYNLSFSTVDGTPNISGQVEKLTFAKNKGFGNTKFKKREDLLKKKKSYLPRDTLTVRCHMWKCFFENVVAKECHASTTIDVERCYLTWSIKNFSANESNVKQTVPFVPASTKVPPIEIKWYISGNNSNVYIDIIQNGKKMLTTTYLHCTIALVDSKGNSEILTQDDHIFEPLTDDQKWTLPPLMEKSKVLLNKENYLPNDELSLTCEMAISVGEETSSIDESNFITPSSLNFEQNTNSTKALKSDLLSMYTEKKFCDVTLRTTSKCLLAHKAILSSRSAAFREIVENERLEENGNIINISDVDEHTLNDMLIYIYSGTVETLCLENAIKLYCAADKYRVPSLKKLCCNFLQSVLNLGNVCLILALADEHKDAEMKDFILNFICENADEIFNSKQWKDFMPRKIILANEVMHSAWKKH